MRDEPDKRVDVAVYLSRELSLEHGVRSNTSSYKMAGRNRAAQIANPGHQKYHLFKCVLIISSNVAYIKSAQDSYL